MKDSEQIREVVHTEERVWRLNLDEEGLGLGDILVTTRSGYITAIRLNPARPLDHAVELTGDELHAFLRVMRTVFTQPRFAVTEDIEPLPVYNIENVLV